MKTFFALLLALSAVTFLLPSSNAQSSGLVMSSAPVSVGLLVFSPETEAVFSGRRRRNVVEGRRRRRLADINQKK